MAEALPLEPRLPVDGVGKKATGWWGIWTLIATEGALFGYLLLSYYYLYFQTKAYWPPEGKPELLMPGINTAILLSSSAFVWWCEHLIKRRRHLWGLLPLAVAIVLGTLFILIQLREWSRKMYGLTSNQYGSIYFTVTGFHMMHVAVGLVILSTLFLWTALGYFDEKRHTAFTVGGMYWHFVDAVWIFIFSSFYLFPYVYMPGGK